MRSLVPVLALLISFVILCLGHGLQSVLLPARATLEQYSDPMLGLLMSTYFIGFIIGTFTAPQLILRVGHIHVFAAAAAGACVTVLGYPLAPYPFVWVVLRLIYGLCLVHMYTVMESWLNSISEPGTRGRILSVYMILNFIAMSLGQMMFFSTSVGGFEMFSITAILLASSLIPLLLSRTAKPSFRHSPERFGVSKLYALSPLGVAGGLVAGLAGGTYWGLTAPYILKLGFSQAHTAWFMASSMVGGLLAQWPLGALSDRMNRRWVILLATGLVFLSALLLATMALVPDITAEIGTPGLLACAVLFGAGFHPLYSLCIAHANDFVPAEQFVRASAGLQLVQSIGAATGPLLVGTLMQFYGNIVPYGFIAALTGILALYTLERLFENRIPRRIQPFQLLTRTGVVAFLLDPRNKMPRNQKT